jgi:hypothetical protein
MEQIKLVEYLRKRYYKYVPTTFFVSSELCNVFKLKKKLYTIENPVSSKKDSITTSKKYFDLIYKMANYQHLKKPLKVYTFNSNGGYDEISGIVISKSINPLKYMKELLLNEYKFEKSKRNFFKLVHKCKLENELFEVGLYDNINHGHLLKEIGYRDMPDIIYFCYRLKW